MKASTTIARTISTATTVAMAAYTICPSLRFAADLREPPAQPDEQEAPVLEELGRLALEPVADELQHPANDEDDRRGNPQRRPHESGDRHQDRNHDQRDAQRMAE